MNSYLNIRINGKNLEKKRRYWKCNFEIWWRSEGKSWWWSYNCRKSVLLYKIGKLNESLECLNQIKNIRNASIIELKAVILMGMSNYKRALDLLNEVLKLDCGNVSALYYKTECLFKLKRFKEVVDTADVALKIDKNHQSILINKFCSLVELNNTKKLWKLKKSF